MSAAGFVQKYTQQCPDCGGSNFVDDHQQGDLICKVRPNEARAPSPCILGCSLMGL